MRWAAAVAVLLACAAVGTGAQAEPLRSGQLTTSQALVEGNAVQSGPLALLSIASILPPSQGAPGLSWLKLEAASVEVLQLNDTGYVYGPVNTVRLLDSALEPADYDGTIESGFAGTSARITLDDVQDAFNLNLHALGDLPHAAAQLQHAEYAAIRDPTMGPDGILAAAVANPQGEGQQYFEEVQLQGPYVQLTQENEVNTVVVEGDIVLEMTGFVLDMDSDGDDTKLYSSANERGLVRPGWDSGVLEREESFLRIEARQARLEIAIDGPGVRTQWTLASLEGVQDRVTFYETAGIYVDARGHEVELQGDRLTADATRVTAVPAEEGLRVALGQRGKDTSGALMGGAEATPIAIAGVVLLLGIAVTAHFALRTRPGIARLDQMEDALHRGDYVGARRIADAILRRQPGLEDALLGKAIALSKSGQPDRVIRTVRRQISKQEPSDGVLHYVLGLAHLDLGHQDQARDALEEAMRRTPALEASIAPRLGRAAAGAAAAGRPAGAPRPEGYA